MSKYNRTIKLMEMLIFKMEEEVEEVTECIKKNEKVKANLEEENSKTSSNIENMKAAIKELNNR